MSTVLLPDTARAGAANLAPDAFKSAFRTHAAGVAVITADAGDGPVGLTATSVSSVSAEPPLLIFSVSARSSAAPVLRRADSVVVHLLGTDDLPIAALCATSGIDRFADRGIWSRLESGEPYFPSVQAWLRCKVVERLDVGESTIVIARATASAVESPATEPLVYHDRTWHALGAQSALPD